MSFLKLTDGSSTWVHPQAAGFLAAFAWHPCFDRHGYRIASNVFGQEVTLSDLEAWLLLNHGGCLTSKGTIAAENVSLPPEELLNEELRELLGSEPMDAIARRVIEAGGERLPAVPALV